MSSNENGLKRMILEESKKKILFFPPKNYFFSIDKGFAAPFHPLPP